MNHSPSLLQVENRKPQTIHRDLTLLQHVCSCPLYFVLAALEGKSVSNFAVAADVY
jgi:hypothetical protein